MKQMIAKAKNNTKAIIGTILIVAIAGFGVNALTKKDVQPPVDTTTPIETPTEPVKAPVRRPAVQPTAPSVTPDTRNYADLILAYKDKTVQFNSQCQVPPLPQRGWKMGTDILLDNRSSQPATIKIGTTTHTLGSYGYKVVSLDQPGTYMVDCNDRQNVTTLTVQR